MDNLSKHIFSGSFLTWGAMESFYQHLPPASLVLTIMGIIWYSVLLWDRLKKRH